jgi:glycosyltransferase involved in cell wall biosynthesis
LTGARRADISVLLPVFWREASPQAARALRRALDSVLAQEYPEDVEVLLIDDGSPSPVQDSFRGTAYATDRRLRWLRLPRNGGLVHALDLGLQAARHELIARIDADDAWRPGKIGKQLQLFAADPGLSITATGLRLVYADGAPGAAGVDDLRPGDWQGILEFFRTVGCPFPHGSVLGLRAVFRLLGGYSHDPRFAHCEDFHLWGTWLRFFKPAMVEEVLYDYTVSATSISGTHAEEQRRAARVVQQTFLDLGDTRRIPAALEGLSATTGLSLLETGALCHQAWKHRQPGGLPVEGLAHLRVLMPDRILLAAGGPGAARLSFG